MNYKKVYDRIESDISSFTDGAQAIMTTLGKYEGRNRTGDKYVRMLFNCAMLYYVDRIWVC